MLKKIGIWLILVFCAVSAGANIAGLREYYYFYSKEAPNDLRVIHVNEVGTLLDGPRILLNNNEVSGVAVSKNASGQYIVLTENNFLNGRVKRYVFTPPGTISGGQTVFDTSDFHFNIDLPESLPGSAFGSNEGNAANRGDGVAISSNGSAAGDFYAAISLISNIVFVGVRKDGGELSAVSLCCSQPEILIQSLNGQQKPTGDPVVVARTNQTFPLNAARLSDDGRFLIASSDAAGLQLYRLDPVTRKPIGSPTKLNVKGGLVHFDSTVINEDGTFVIFTQFQKGGRVKFIQADGNGHFVGSAKTLVDQGDHNNYGVLIRAN
ncbi:MAG TPA: hypothetical protein VFG11_04115 [Acidobacteriota bacterium]|nr:hypothetical protein [Acidobacteriota bacterium]